MSYEKKINELKINLPKAADPVGSYVATKISGKMLFISGQISMSDKGELIKGKLGKDLDTQAGYDAAKRCALSIVAQAKKACSDDLSKIKSCVKPVSYTHLRAHETDSYLVCRLLLEKIQFVVLSAFSSRG